MTKTKMLIIGVDGASLDLVLKWRNELPNLSYLMHEGAWGELESTIPPITLPAWASFATGKRPGKLGFFDFRKVEFNPRRTRFIRTEDWGPAIWDILSENDYRVGVLNFPGTYPPKKVKGFMVSGFLSPSSSNIYYPKFVGKDIKRIIKNYRIYPDINPYLSSEEKYIDNVYDVFLERLKVTKYLIQNYDCELFIVVFMILDWIQHYFWKHMDPNHPLHQSDNMFHDTIKNSYLLVDSAIGQLLKLVREDTHIMILSDHGFGGLHGFFFINSWLYQRGYLHPKRDIKQIGLTPIIKSKKIRRLLSKLNINVTKISSRIKYEKIFRKFLPNEISGDDPFTQNLASINVDWKKTKAFGFGYYNEIYVNTKGRGGCVDSKEYRFLMKRIVEDLEKLGERSGLKFQIYTRDELHVDISENAPDIIYLINDGEYVQSNRFNFNRLFELSREKSGDHRLFGIWILKGPKIKKVNNKRVNICDLAPTLYNLFEVTEPSDIDGLIIKEVIKELYHITNIIEK